MPTEPTTPVSQPGERRPLLAVLADAARLLSSAEALVLGSAAPALGAELHAHMLAGLATRAKQSANAKPGGGRPPSGFVIVATNLGACLMYGANETAAQVAKLVAALDGNPRYSLTGNTLQASLSRKGEWSKQCATMNGEVSVTVTRATETEEAEWRAAEAAGTAKLIEPPKHLTKRDPKKLA